jgi:cold shock CspA family protein
MRGRLTRFNETSGKGTITSDQGVEVLMYKEAVEPNRQPLKQGQTVHFRIYYGPAGPLAENVQGYLD